MKDVAMIGICPVCNQGRLLIARDKQTGIDYIACEDCEAEWESPSASKDLNKVTRHRFGESAFLSLEEALIHPWKEFIK
jgi:predicted DCC family thiol-disulfide oxidoreductase YuxK